MIKFIKYSSLMIILLFFPISFYFNIIPINCDFENNLHVKMSITIYPDENYTRWCVYVFDLFLESNNEPLIIEDIDWGEVNRNGNTFYINISIREFRSRTKNGIVPILGESNEYDLGPLESGNYTFIVYVNKEQYCIKEFFIKEIKPIPYYVAIPHIKWNGEEWVARVELVSKMVPKGIHLGPLLRTKDGFEINITVEEWSKSPILKKFHEFGEYHYSLGILPEGKYWFCVYINGIINTFVLFHVSRTFVTYIFTIHTPAKTFIAKLNETTVTLTLDKESKLEFFKAITITVETEFKEKTKIEKFIQIFLFIIIIVALLLYHVFQKKKTD